MDPTKFNLLIDQWFRPPKPTSHRLYAKHLEPEICQARKFKAHLGFGKIAPWHWDHKIGKWIGRLPKTEEHEDK